MPSPRPRSDAERAAMLETAQKLLDDIGRHRWVITAKDRDDLRQRFRAAGAPADAVDAVLPRIETAQAEDEDGRATRQNSLASASLSLIPTIGVRAALGWACVCPQVEGLWPEDAVRAWGQAPQYGWLCAAAGLSPSEVAAGDAADAASLAAMAAMRGVIIPAALLPVHPLARTRTRLSAAWDRARSLFTALT